MIVARSWSKWQGEGGGSGAWYRCHQVLPCLSPTCYTNEHLILPVSGCITCVNWLLVYLHVVYLNWKLVSPFSFSVSSDNKVPSDKRICRIITKDFPQYFAIISRVRQETSVIGTQGGMLNSSVVPQVQAVFPEGTLTKKIKVGLQVSSPSEMSALIGCPIVREGAETSACVFVM